MPAEFWMITSGLSFLGMIYYLLVYLGVRGKNKKLLEERKDWPRLADEEVKKKLKEADTEAVAMLHRAQELAERIIDQAKAMSEKQTNRLGESVEAGVEELEAELKREALAAVKQIRLQLQQQAQMERGVMLKQMEEAKAAEVVKVKAKVAEAVDKLALKVLGEGLSREQEEGLIIKAIDEAKRDGII